jgi:putative ABC transport system permease protein
LAAVTLVNTLVVTALDHRDALFLLWRVGTTKGQLLASVAWQSALVGVVGVVLGLATGVAPVMGAARALTGNWHPYVPWPAVGAVAAGVLLLAGVATLGPTMRMLRRVDGPA